MKGVSDALVSETVVSDTVISDTINTDIVASSVCQSSNVVKGILTSRNCFIFPCALSDGTIGVCIWRTKENRPKHHLVSYHPNTKQIVLVTNTSWMKNVNCLPLTQFNQIEVMR